MQGSFLDVLCFERDSVAIALPFTTNWISWSGFCNEHNLLLPNSKLSVRHITYFSCLLIGILRHNNILNYIYSCSQSWPDCICLWLKERDDRLSCGGYVITSLQLSVLQCFCRKWNWKKVQKLSRTGNHRHHKCTCNILCLI